MSKLLFKNYNSNDTISAIATFPSQSALGVIKISGKKAIEITRKIFKPSKAKNIKKAKGFTLHYGWIKDKSNEVVDEVLVSVMRKPNSYTREDVIEISSHGGTYLVNKILELVLANGSRLAMPGEFTYRAVTSGRVDLLQAQSILDIVEAQNSQALTLALKQLKGEASAKIAKIKESIKELFSQTEALINFPQEELEIPLNEFKDKFKSLTKDILNLLKGSREARILKEGMRCVICGKTNVGKSTIFNRLLREERVIVARSAGTTRDVVEETINVKGILLRIYDTAGILEPRDFIEKKAVAKSNQIFEDADLIILVIDASRKLNKDDLFLLERIKNRKSIIVLNKSDLVGARSPRPKKKGGDTPPLRKELKKYSSNVCTISALKDKGLNRLEAAIFKSVYQKGLDRKHAIFLSQYQRNLLMRCAEKIQESSALLDKGFTVDFINLTLKEAMDDLGRLSGEVYCHEVLEDIFSKFCIGK